MSMNTRRQYLNAVAALFLLGTFSAVTYAADCTVIPLAPQAKNMQIIEKYVGGCKDGKADGAGQYAYTFTNASNETVTIKVSGFFKNGMLNGLGKTGTSTGSEFSGTFVDNKRDGPGKTIWPTVTLDQTWRDGRLWDGVTLSTDSKGVRLALQTTQGKQTGLCRSDRNIAPDKEGGMCNPDLLRQLDPAASFAKAAPAPSAPPPKDGSQGNAKKDDVWGSWLEATGNKPAQAPVVGAVKVTGSSSFSVAEVQRACAKSSLTRSTHWSRTVNMGMKADGVISAVEFFPSIDGSETGHPYFGLAKFKGKVTPAKINIKFPRDVEIPGVKIYLFKDGFGEATCIEG